MGGISGKPLLIPVPDLRGTFSRQLPRLTARMSDPNWLFRGKTAWIDELQLNPRQHCILESVGEQHQERRRKTDVRLDVELR